MRWPLAALLGVREREEVRRAAALGLAARREAEAHAALEGLRAIAARASGEVAAGTPVHALARASRFARAAELEAEHAALGAVRASEEVAARRAEASAAARERSALTRHRARWEALRRRERERREEDARDELVSDRVRDRG